MLIFFALALLALSQEPSSAAAADTGILIETAKEVDALAIEVKALSAMLREARLVRAANAAAAADAADAADAVSECLPAPAPAPAEAAPIELHESHNGDGA